MNTSGKNDQCSMFIAGDICLSNTIDDKFISDELCDLIKSHDLRIANWEAPIINNEHQKINKAGPHIHQDKSYKIFLERKLFNLYSIANNHILDFGKDGLEETIKELRNTCKILGAGLTYNDIYKPLVSEINHVKIAFIACAESQFGCVKYANTADYGYAWVFSDLIPKLIQDLKNKVDFVVVLPHAGLEMENFPLPEWRRCYKNFIEYGADLVIASHPHVIQPKEIYQGKAIYYSLGNLLFNSDHKDERWSRSIGLSIDFIKANHQIEINECFIKFEQNLLQLDRKEQTHYISLCKTILIDEVYKQQIESICLNAWKGYYESYYTYGKFDISYTNNFFKLPAVLRKLIDKILNTILRKNNIKNQVLLYHNISIETHRFVVERALKKLNNIL